MNKKDLIKIGISKKQFPRIIYRYYRIDDNFYTGLAESYLWFSNPSSFNDPFDCKVNLSREGSIEDYKKFLFNSSVFNSNDQHEIENKAHQLKNDNALLTRINNKVKEIVNRIGVCCFSYENDNIPMWSYYANNHTGIVIGYDLYELINGEMTPFRVRYDKEYPAINWITKDPKTDISILMLGTKSNSWSHENEFRIVSTIQGKNPILTSALREIVFGCKINSSDKSVAIDLISKHYNITGLNFFDAKLKSNEYKLIIENCS